jgi:hypothetical protein
VVERVVVGRDEGPNVLRKKGKKLLMLLIFYTRLEIVNQSFHA